jgi:hypothetical protein
MGCQSSRRVDAPFTSVLTAEGSEAASRQTANVVDMWLRRDLYRIE